MVSYFFAYLKKAVMMMDSKKTEIDNPHTAELTWFLAKCFCPLYGGQASRAAWLWMLQQLVMGLLWACCLVVLPPDSESEEKSDCYPAAARVVY